MTYTLGIDLGGTYTTLAVVDTCNHIVWESRFPTAGAAGFGGFLERLTRAATPALASYPCAAAGVVAAAQVDAAGGAILTSPNLGFEHVPLGAEVSSRLGVPTIVENDVNAAAYAEYLAAPGARQPFLAVFVGTGVGAGLVAEGRIYRGADGFAAEIGHVPVVTAGGERCGCGRDGCLEAYAGGLAIIRRAAPAANTAAVPPFQSVDDVVACAAAGDAACRRALEEAAFYLGVALAAAVNLFNPGTLVLGGGVARAWPELRARAERRMRASALPVTLARLAVLESAWGPAAGAVGAAALARGALAEGR